MVTVDKFELLSREDVLEHILEDGDNVLILKEWTVCVNIDVRQVTTFMKFNENGPCGLVELDEVRDHVLITTSLFQLNTNRYTLQALCSPCSRGQFVAMLKHIIVNKLDDDELRVEPAQLRKFYDANASLAIAVNLNGDVYGYTIRGKFLTGIDHITCYDNLTDDELRFNSERLMVVTAYTIVDGRPALAFVNEYAEPEEVMAADVAVHELFDDLLTAYQMKSTDN